MVRERRTNSVVGTIFLSVLENRLDAEIERLYLFG